MLHVYDEDGKEVEEVNFRYLDGKQEYHQTFVDHGFQLKSQEELQLDPRYRRAQEEKEFIELLIANFGFFVFDKIYGRGEEHCVEKNRQRTPHEKPNQE